MYTERKAMKEKKIIVDGCRISYVEEGEGQPLLYIHGNTGSSRWFSKVMGVQGYRTLALDMPNFGQSEPLSVDVDLNGYADRIVRYMEVLGLHAPVLAGHSLGGAVAQSIAVRYPGLIKALVLIDSSSPHGLITPVDRYPLIEMMRKDRALLTKALAATVPTLKDAALFETLVDDAVLMAPKAWVGNAAALSSFDLGEKTRNFTQPVLVLWGKGDFLVSKTMAEETAGAYPAAKLVELDNIGHSIIVEDPGRFLGILQDFLASL
jgi:branched-chain amino acid transport system permease protein